MPASFSPEALIDLGICSFGISGRVFVQLANQLGVEISNSSFAEKIKTGLDTSTAQRLLDVLRRMQLLQDRVALPINWVKVEAVSTALTAVQLEELNKDDERFAQFAKTATEAVLK
jgi:hypothetical protein